jgi:hypothetical protein
MIKRKYFATHKATICFNGDFYYHDFEDSYYPLDEITAKTESLMYTNDFEYAIITDAETGEILVEMQWEG